MDCTSQKNKRGWAVSQPSPNGRDLEAYADLTLDFPRTLFEVPRERRAPRPCGKEHAALALASSTLERQAPAHLNDAGAGGAGDLTVVCRGHGACGSA